MRGISALGRTAALMLGLAPASVQAFPEGAPPAHTGGFGEPHCGSCHLSVEPPPKDTGLQLTGLGDTYAPGRTYEFELHLVDPGQVVGGFQLSVRFIDAPHRGQSAGRLEATGDGLKVIEQDGVQYLGHRAVGRRDNEAIRWRIRWTAPEPSRGEVVFHIGAVAGNDDDSPLGDTVHVLRHRLRPD